MRIAFSVRQVLKLGEETLQRGTAALRLDQIAHRVPGAGDGNELLASGAIDVDTFEAMMIDAIASIAK